MLMVVQELREERNCPSFLRDELFTTVESCINFAVHLGGKQCCFIHTFYNGFERYRIVSRIVGQQLRRWFYCNWDFIFPRRILRMHRNLNIRNAFAYHCIYYTIYVIIN